MVMGTFSQLAKSQCHLFKPLVPLLGELGLYIENRMEEYNQIQINSGNILKGIKDKYLNLYFKHDFIYKRHIVETGRRPDSLGNLFMQRTQVQFPTISSFGSRRVEALF